MRTRGRGHGHASHVSIPPCAAPITIDHRHEHSHQYDPFTNLHRQSAILLHSRFAAVQGRSPCFARDSGRTSPRTMQLAPHAAHYLCSAVHLNGRPIHLRTNHPLTPNRGKGNRTSAQIVCFVPYH